MAADYFRGRRASARGSAKVLERITAMRAAGAGWTEIANALNTFGIPTRSGGKWFASTVCNLFSKRRPKVE
jgi:hypothetical protein